MFARCFMICSLCLALGCNTLDTETGSMDMGTSNTGNQSGTGGGASNTPPNNLPNIPSNNGGGSMMGDSMNPEDQPLPMMDDPPGGSTPTSSAQCIAMCEYLEMCNACFYDEVGNCLDVPGCAEVCDREVAPPISACVAGLQACDEPAFLACYDENIGDDDCANTCRFLEECEECFLDEQGECLSIASCALVCRMSTPPAAAACIAQLNDCGGIDGCYQQ